MAVNVYGIEFAVEGIVIGQVVDIQTPQISKAIGDRSHLGSPGQWREKISSWKDGGEFSLTIIHNGASYAQLLSLIDDNSLPLPCTITFPVELENSHTAGAVLAFDAIFGEMGNPETGRDDDDPMMIDLSGQVHGIPVFTEGS